MSVGEQHNECRELFDFIHNLEICKDVHRESVGGEQGASARD
jgi:hypothetical protein